MKNKLRKIVIDEKEYFYRVTNKYCPPDNNKLTIRIFLSGYKQTPLVIEFWTVDDFRMGQLLLQGVKLFNHKTEISININFNEPGCIRSLILWGIEKGWTGENKIPVQDGMEFLRESGFEITFLCGS